MLLVRKPYRGGSVTDVQKQLLNVEKKNLNRWKREQNERYDCTTMVGFFPRKIKFPSNS